MTVLQMRLKIEVKKKYGLQSPKCTIVVLVVGKGKYPQLCQSCGHKHVKKSSDCIIIECRLGNKLKFFMEHLALQSYTSNEQRNGDVGNAYGTLENQGKIDCFTLIFQINPDDAKKLKTNKYSF
jgi:hypothetical protein